MTIKFHFENLSIFLKKENVHTCQTHALAPTPPPPPPPLPLLDFVRFSMTPFPPLLNERTF